MVTPAINKTGSLVAPCGSTWAQPGLHLYFPNLGYLEVLGANGNVVTYRNLTIEPATEVPAGFCFVPDAPPLLLDTDENGDPVEQEASSTLDAIYGVEGNAARQIVPVNGTILYARGGKWERRQAGLMAYPVPLTQIVNELGKTFSPDELITVALPNKPSSSLLNGTLGFRVELICRLGLWTTGTGTSDMAVTVNNQQVVAGATQGITGQPTSDLAYATPDIDKSESNITFKTERISGSGSMTYNLRVWVRGYQY